MKFLDCYKEWMKTGRLPINRTKNRLEKLIMACVRSEIKPRFASLWGQREFIRPAYCGIVNGNGRQVVWLKTGDSRPSYYILRIDSSIDIDSDDFDPEILYVGVEEQFGNSDDYEEQYINGRLMVKEKYCDGDWMPFEKSCFPALSTGNGAWWGLCKNFN